MPNGQLGAAMRTSNTGGVFCAGEGERALPADLFPAYMESIHEFGGEAFLDWLTCNRSCSSTGSPTGAQE